MWESLNLKDVVALARDPYPSIRQWARDTGKKVVGSTIADVPEEVIYAYDLLPVTLLGTHKPLKKAASHLPDNACSLARSNLELALSYEGDLFSGFVLPQVCDTTQHLSDIWRISFPDKYVESYLAPRQADRPSAHYWVKEEIERLIASLGKWTGKTLSNDALGASIAIHNENKKILSEIYEIKRNNPGTITNLQFFAMMKLSLQVDKAEFNKSLKAIKDGLKLKKSKGLTDIVLVGITCDPPEVFDIFDELKLNIVGDTLVDGTRYLRGAASLDGNLVDALADRHFTRGFFSPIHDNVYKNFEEVKKLYYDMKAKAIIYVHIEFCESQEYDLPDLKSMIKKEGIPMHVLDTEYQTVSLSHILTRAQAFFESLKGGAL
jgi:benzoyl-CoA reductase/2-hydroxyglutaryl-CoA dehydratase subunit BcrC/BadD/HgdB